MTYEKLKSGLIVPRGHVNRRRFLAGLGAAIIVPKPARAQLMVNELVGFGAGGVKTPTLTYIGSSPLTTNATSYNFGNFTAATAGLMIVVAMATSGGSPSISGVSIGGTAGTIHYNTGAGAKVVAIASRVVSAGANNVTVTTSSNGNNCAVSVYLLTDYVSATPTTGATNTGTGTSLAASFTIPAGSAAVFGVTHANTNATSWSVGTGNYDATNETIRVSSASLTTQSVISGGSTASWTGSVAAAIAGATWS